MSTTAATARLAVDIGGTFTDVVLERSGERATIKVLTTPGAPELVARIAHQPSKRPTISTAFWPPNPKAFDMITRRGASRDCRGT